jgi:hypothetical protein
MNHQHIADLPCLQGPTGTSTPAKLISAAFPALQRLELVQLSLDWKDLHALTSCPQLSCLVLDTCTLPAAAPATNPLAALASLRELHVTETCSSIAQGLTQVTSLYLHSETDTLSQLVIHRLKGMLQLQQLELGGADNDVPAAVVAQLFSASPHLAGLTLFTTISQQAFDALLAHATQLTRLACQRLYLSQDRSQSACSWKELVVADHCCIATLAHLPLHNLSRVHFSACGPGEEFEIPSACPCLMYNSHFCTPAQLQAALVNLATCPAWQDSGPSVHIRLTSYRQGSQQQTVEHLISGLAPLSGRSVQLLLDAHGLQVTEDIAERLGTTLGHSLTHLKLSMCTIHHDFWPAVWRHLPALQELSLMWGAGGAVSSSDLAGFCTLATRPFLLRLSEDLYGQVGRAVQREQRRRRQGVPQVTVTLKG